MRVDRDRLKRAGCGSARDQPWKGPQSAHKRAKRFEAACAKAVPSAADPRYWRARYIFILAAMSSTASPVTSTSAFFTVPVNANGGV